MIQLTLAVLGVLFFTQIAPGASLRDRYCQNYQSKSPIASHEIDLDSSGKPRLGALAGLGEYELENIISDKKVFEVWLRAKKHKSNKVITAKLDDRGRAISIVEVFIDDKGVVTKTTSEFKYLNGYCVPNSAYLMSKNGKKQIFVNFDVCREYILFLGGHKKVSFTEKDEEDISSIFKKYGINISTLEFSSEFNSRMEKVKIRSYLVADEFLVGCRKFIPDFDVINDDTKIWKHSSVNTIQQPKDRVQ